MCNRCNHLATGISELEALFDVISQMPEDEERSGHLASIGRVLAQGLFRYATEQRPS